METVKRTRRQHFKPLPLPLLIVLALLLFAAGLGIDRSGAAAHEPAEMENPGAAISDPVVSESALRAPNPASYKPSPASAGDDWALMLVNFENPLPDGFSVSKLTELRSGHAVDSRVYPALQRMMDDARAAGLQPVICSSFRSWDDQERLFEAEVQNWLGHGYTRWEAEVQAAMWVARPGTSEHQTGLAVDIVDLSYQILNAGQEDTPVQQWLKAHCAEYGFILRYPNGKSALTGVGYEPWHYRYVGVEAAKEIMGAGLCLEEYLLAQ